MDIIINLHGIDIKIKLKQILRKWKVNISKA